MTSIGTFQSQAPRSHRCGACPVRHMAFCARCTKDELAELEALKKYKAFRSGETVKLPGFEMPYVASVVSGAAYISESLEDGRNQIVGILLPSDLFGLRGKKALNRTITALTDLTLCSFDRRNFEALMETNANVVQQLLERALNDLDNARNWLTLLGRKSAFQRVAVLIAMVARIDAKSNGREFTGRMDIELGLSRAQIADALGLTLETVSREITKLTEGRFIESVKGPKMVIRDVEALAAVA